MSFCQDFEALASSHCLHRGKQEPCPQLVSHPGIHLLLVPDMHGNCPTHPLIQAPLGCQWDLDSHPEGSLRKAGAEVLRERGDAEALFFGCLWDIEV